jgi:hypothetical protein
MRTHLFYFASLASFPLSGTAQPSPPAAPHLYIGVGASALSYAPASSYSKLTSLAPALTAGVQLRPQWAVQVGAALSWRRYADTQSYARSPGQPPTVYTYDNHLTYLTIPLLARYSWATLAARFHLDALAGLTLLHVSQHFTSTSTEFGQAPYQVDEQSSFTRGSLSLGPAVRYALASQVELTGDALVNVAVGESYYQFKDRFFFNLLAGVRYTFGPR